jgi:FkbH-like protein
MRTLLISDFNTGNLLAFLRSHKTQPAVEFVSAAFGQVTPVLLNTDDPAWAGVDYAFVWTRPEGVIQTFREFLSFAPVTRQEVFSEVDAFAEHLLRAADRTKLLLMASWELAPHHPGHGMLDLNAEAGASRLLLEMNLRLMQRLDGHPGVIVLNSRKWFQLSEGQAFNPRLWYLGKIPFSNSVFKNAAADLKATLRGALGHARKLLILDLDDTLWDGIVGDVGWQGLKLGGHDPVGEALVDFQREIKALNRRGVLLGIVSKNEETTALAAIKEHPEMILRAADFAGWRINWSDKAQNIVELVTQLNLGLDSVVFIDDNPVERARVRETLPEVLVPEWPEDKRLYPAALLELGCFDSPALTREDRGRVQMYASENQRAALKVQANSLEDWLRTLATRVVVEPLTDVNRARVVQLFNKTNQMNLSTRRLTEAELLAWLEGSGRALWAFRVSDRFGDSGLTGIASLEMSGRQATLADFILSCRVMGRRVEETMLHVAIQFGRVHAVDELIVSYKQTPKNKPCLEFFKSSGFVGIAEHTFRWDLSRDYPLPNHIELSGLPTESASLALS